MLHTVTPANLLSSVDVNFPCCKSGYLLEIRYHYVIVTPSQGRMPLHPRICNSSRVASPSFRVGGAGYATIKCLTRYQKVLGSIYSWIPDLCYPLFLTLSCLYNLSQ